MLFKHWLRVEGLMATEYTEPARGDDMLIRSFMLKECARCEDLHAERTDGMGPVVRTAGAKIFSLATCHKPLATPGKFGCGFAALG